MSKIVDWSLDNPNEKLPSRRLSEAEEEEIRKVFNSRTEISNPDYQWYNDHPTAE